MILSRNGAGSTPEPRVPDATTIDRTSALGVDDEAGGTLAAVSTMPPDPTADVIGQVMRIMRYPVKSVGGEQVASADVSEDGILGDRAFGIVDATSGLLLSAHTVPLLPSRVPMCR